MKKIFKKFFRFILPIVVLLLLLGFLFQRLNFLKIQSSTDHSGDYAVEIKKDSANQKEIWVWDKRPELGMGVFDTTNFSEIDATKDLGVRIVRTTLSWKRMLTDSAYSQIWDQRVSLAKTKGIELEVVVHENPPGETYANREGAYKDYANFMAAMATRYPSVHYWELFNEMDSGFQNNDLFGAITGISMAERGKLYAQMLKVAYPAIKNANPNAFVLTGGMTNWTDFPKGIYGGGGKDFFDIMAMHTYGLPVITSFKDRGQSVRQIMDANGDSGKPLWDTEFGVDAGSIQKGWNYPKTWTVAPGKDTANDTPQCNWSSLPKDSGGKLLYDGDGFDYSQCQQWRTVIYENQNSKIFNKILPYQLSAANSTKCKDYNSTNPSVYCPGAVLQKSNSANDTIDDYGFGITRDPETPLIFRPTYNWLKSAAINSNILLESSYTTDVVVKNLRAFAPQGYKYSSGDNLVIKGVKINSFFPTKIILNKKIITESPQITLTPILPATPLNPEQTPQISLSGVTQNETSTIVDVPTIGQVSTTLSVNRKNAPASGETPIVMNVKIINSDGVSISNLAPEILVSGSENNVSAPFFTNNLWQAELRSSKAEDKMIYLKLNGTQIGGPYKVTFDKPLSIINGAHSLLYFLGGTLSIVIAIVLLGIAIFFFRYIYLLIRFFRKKNFK